MVPLACMGANWAHRKSLLQVGDLRPGLGLGGEGGIRKLLGAQQALLQVAQLLALPRALPLSGRQPARPQTA